MRHERTHTVASFIGASACVAACTIIAPLDDIARDRDGGSAGASGDASTSGGSSGVGGTTGGSSGAGGTTGGSSGVGANNSGGQSTGGVSPRDGGPDADSSIPDGPSCTPCGDAGCVDLQNDRDNCGACGYACAGTLGCSNGACEQVVHELVVGEYRSCALLTDPDGSGSYPLLCWGSTDHEFFHSQTPPADPKVPSAVNGIDRVRGMTLGTNRFCFIQPAAETVSCWGDCYAECEPDVANPAGFIDTTFGSVSQVAIADGILPTRGGTCAVGPTRFLDCWGFADMVTDVADRTSPSAIYLEGRTSILNATEVSGVYANFCAVTPTGEVACWGDKAYGYVAWGIPTPDGGTVPDGAAYVQLEAGGTLTGVQSVSVSLANGCAVTATGELYCWGDNQLGFLGIGGVDSHVGAVLVNLANVSQVAVGATHTCAIAGGGQLYCWGFVGNLGLGPDAVGDILSNSYFSTPQPLPGFNDVLEVKTTNGHSCLRRKNGQVMCWGTNDSGQVGDGTQLQRYVPTPVVSLP